MEHCLGDMEQLCVNTNPMARELLLPFLEPFTIIHPLKMLQALASQKVAVCFP